MTAVAIAVVFVVAVAVVGWLWQGAGRPDEPAWKPDERRRR